MKWRFSREFLWFHFGNDFCHCGQVELINQSHGTVVGIWDGVLKSISSFLQNYGNTGYLLNIMFIFDRIHGSFDLITVDFKWCYYKLTFFSALLCCLYYLQKWNAIIQILKFMHHSSKTSEPLGSYFFLSLLHITSIQQQCNVLSMVNIIMFTRVYLFLRDMESDSRLKIDR